MKLLKNFFLKKPHSKTHTHSNAHPPSAKKSPSIETYFLVAMLLIIVCGLTHQLYLGYFHQPLVAGKISPVKRQNLARAMENVERKRHRILTGEGKSLTTPVK